MSSALGSQRGSTQPDTALLSPTNMGGGFFSDMDSVSAFGGKKLLN